MNTVPFLGGEGVLNRIIAILTMTGLDFVHSNLHSLEFLGISENSRGLRNSQKAGNSFGKSVIMGHNPLLLLLPSLIHGPFMSWVNLPVIVHDCI